MSPLDLSLGAVELGVLVSTVLFGVATTQAWLYLERNFKDALYIRIMVGLVWVLESAHTAFIWVHLYTLTVTSREQPIPIDATLWCLASTVAFSGFLGSIVQSFFAHRLRVLSGNLIIPTIVWIAALWRSGFGVAASVLFFNARTVTNFRAHYEWVITTSFVVNAAVDVLIAGSSCFCLLHRQTSFNRSHRILEKLVMFSIETGLITSLCGIATLALSLAVPQTLAALGLFLAYPKLFSNSLFTALNARQYLRQTGEYTMHGWSSGLYMQPFNETESNVGTRPSSLKPVPLNIPPSIRMSPLSGHERPPNFTNA